MTRLIVPTLKGLLLRSPTASFCHPRCSRISTQPPKRHSRGVLAVLSGNILNLAGGNLGDHNGVADGIGGTLFRV